jgi:hypothetical protein
MRIGCLDQLRLRRAVVEAMNTMYDAQHDVELALTQHASSLESLSLTLGAATRKALNAKRDFDEHVKEHGCCLRRFALDLTAVAIESLRRAVLM